MVAGVGGGGKQLSAHLEAIGIFGNRLQKWTTAIIRRLKGHVAADGLTEDEMLRKLYEDIGRL